MFCSLSQLMVRRTMQTIQAHPTSFLAMVYVTVQYPSPDTLPLVCSRQYSAQRHHVWTAFASCALRTEHGRDKPRYGSIDAQKPKAPITYWCTRGDDRQYPALDVCRLFAMIYTNNWPRRGLSNPTQEHRLSCDMCSATGLVVLAAAMMVSQGRCPPVTSI